MFNSSFKRQIDHYGPICPYCGYKDENFIHSYEFNYDSSLKDFNRDVVSCIECDQLFELDIEIAYTFKTTKLEEDE